MARSKEESLIDQAFARLKEADGLEQDDPAQAANKYHEGCFLLKNHIRTVLSRSQNKGEAGKMRALLAEKIDKYELKAEHLRTRSKMMEEDRQKQEQNRENARLRQSTSSSLSSSCNWEMIAHNSQSIRPSGLNTVASSRSLHIDNIEKVATQHASKAGRLLTSAIDHDEIGGNCDDEVIQLYLQSVQHYLDAIKFLSSGADDGAEEKTSQERKQEESYADVHRDLVVSLKRKVKGALDRVEELKSRRGAGSTSSGLPSAETNASEIPIAQTSLTPHEIAVLKRSSRLASVLVLPWSDTDVKTFNFSPSNRYNDPDGLLKLSKKQEIAFSKWARPHEIAEMRGLAPSNIKLIETITPYTIKQYCVSDCSFIAGLCISAAYERRFRRRLVSSLIHPQDKNGMPLYNPKGVYMVKLWLNGVERVVVIDDLFPVDSRGNLLCSHTNTAGLELWVSLLEKAYMKICGGYDFPGSNSGVDLFSLTGWIPERIHFPEDVENVQSFETPPERCWERLYSASAYGDCLITMSTSKELTEDKAKEVGLFTGHAYAVLDVVKTSNGTRLLQLKNPWAKSGWLGRFSSRDQESWADDPGLCSELGYDPKIASHHDDGVFFISWDDVLKYFRNIHLSWSDSLFCCSTKVHDLWRKDKGPTDDSYNVGENPQYCITLSDAALSTNATLWVLLSRHVDKQEQEGGEASCFATVHIHRVRTASERVWYTNSKCVLTGAYTNNQHVLIRYDASGKQDKHLVLVLSQYKKSADLAYTLTALCTEDFALSSPESLPHSKTIHGSWRIRENMQDKSCLLSIGTAGGPAGRGSFGCNPHYCINVKEGMDMQISCKTNKFLLVNVILVESTGRRMQHIYVSPTLDSGAYRHGFCITDVAFVRPGDYTLVVSTFEPGQEGAFVLCVSSSKDLRIRELD